MLYFIVQKTSSNVSIRKFKRKNEEIILRIWFYQVVVLFPVDVSL